MSDSLHKQILARLETVLTTLKTAGTIRELAIRNSAAHGAKALPALHIVPGDEQRTAQDSQGYTCERLYLFKLVFGPARDPFDKAADLVQAVQEAIEADLQLNTLAAGGILYEGEQPWISDETEATEGTFLTYRVAYRRRRAAAAQGY
jgi:hypothetical protein